MDIQRIIVWALILFGIGMLVIGVMEFGKVVKSDKAEYRDLEYDDPRILKLILIQSIIDAVTGALYVFLGALGIMNILDLQIVYGLVFAFAIIKKIVDTGIKTKINKIDWE